MNFEIILGVVVTLLLSSIGIAANSYRKEESKLDTGAHISRDVSGSNSTSGEEKIVIVLSPPTSVTNN